VESLTSTRKRDLHISAEELLAGYESKYHAAQRYYFRTVRPDNEDYQRPVSVK